MADPSPCDDSSLPRVLDTMLETPGLEPQHLNASLPRVLDTTRGNSVETDAYPWDDSQLPRVLNTMRSNSIKKGELVSKPELEGRLENKDEVWNLAVGEVIARTKGEGDDSRGGG